MSNTLEIISIALLIIAFILSSQLYLYNKKLDPMTLYRKIHYLGSLTIERKDMLIQWQDSLIKDHMRTAVLDYLEKKGE